MQFIRDTAQAWLIGSAGQVWMRAEGESWSRLTAVTPNSVLHELKSKSQSGTVKYLYSALWRFGIFFHSKVNKFLFVPVLCDGIDKMNADGGEGAVIRRCPSNHRCHFRHTLVNSLCYLCCQMSNFSWQENLSLLQMTACYAPTIWSFMNVKWIYIWLFSWQLTLKYWPG